MTQSSIDELFPVVKIAGVTEQAIKRCFAIDWRPRVVRQNKQPNAGSLKHVDYAIPCFELARQLGESTPDVAERLAVCIRDSLALGSGVDAVDIKVEAVAGFVNFELSTAYLRAAIKNARDWFHVPEFIGLPQKHNFVVIEPRLVARAPRQQVTTLAYTYLDRLHELLRYPLQGHFLLSDFSHETLDHLTQKRTYRPLKKTDGRFVQNHELLTDERMTASLEQLRTWWTRHHLPQTSRSYAPYEVYTESELADGIHHFLDQLQTSTTQEGIIRDEANKAVYFIHGDQAVPLRSANGLLFRAASVLYVINETLAKHQPDEKIVALVSQKMHPLIYAFAGSIDVHTAVTCFDPYVAKADIKLIHTSVASLRSHFIHMRAALNKQTRVPTDSIHRTAILSLVDLPVELCAFMNANQLPGLFDAIGNSVTTVRYLSTQHSVKVAAN